tara:strand:+ start:280775 stop:281005 length:231 start_codon:yes stop_codon:yes gene_type:complete
MEKKSEFALEKINYMIIGVGVALIIIGFALMSGGRVEDPNIFNEEIFSFRRITLAPVIVLLGFMVNIYGILKRPKN